MKIRALSPRRALTTSLGAAAVVAATFVVAPQAQAATYWQFKSYSYGTCLTAGTSGVAFVSTCSGSAYQQWDFVTSYSDGYNELRNRATLTCLATDDKTDENAIWMTTCSPAPGLGMRFNYFYPDRFTSAYGTNMHPASNGAVHTDNKNVAASYWDGWHS